MMMVPSRKAPRSLFCSNFFYGLLKGGTNDSARNLDYIRRTIYIEDNNILLAPFSMKEFKSTIFNMDSNKSPSSDGMNPIFYKKFGAFVAFVAFYKKFT